MDFAPHVVCHDEHDFGTRYFLTIQLHEREPVSYPDGVQSSDGQIYIIHDFDRHAAKEILMAVFTEEDVAAGKVVSDIARFKVLVNKAGGIIPRNEQKP